MRYHRHISTIGKKLVKRRYVLHMSSGHHVGRHVRPMSVCLYACPLTYLENNMPKLHEIFCMLPMAAAWSSL